jgi:medium-chain acyl-[acyl-carrier-protein] hydrolase
VDPVVSREAVLAWEEQTSADFGARMIAGSHFYIHSAERVLLQMLARDLAELVESEGRPPWSRA